MEAVEVEMEAVAMASTVAATMVEGATVEGSMLVDDEVEVLMVVAAVAKGGL